MRLLGASYRRANRRSAPAGASTKTSAIVAGRFQIEVRNGAIPEGTERKSGRTAARVAQQTHDCRRKAPHRKSRGADQGRDRAGGGKEYRRPAHVHGPGLSERPRTADAVRAAANRWS